MHADGLGSASLLGDRIYEILFPLHHESVQKPERGFPVPPCQMGGWGGGVRPLPHGALFPKYSTSCLHVFIHLVIINIT